MRNARARRADLLLGTLSTRVFETQTATGREHDRQDGGVSPIFILIIPNGEKILVNLVVSRQVKQLTSGCHPRLKNARA